MNYNQSIQTILDSLSQDKGLKIKWRNKAVARLEEAQSFINTARVDTVHTPPPEATDDNMCTCRKNELGSIIAIRQSCIVHNTDGQKVQQNAK